MKLKIAILIAFTQFFYNGYSQEGVDKLKYGPDKELCNEKLSIYTEFYKQKNYADAYEPWRYLFENAPKRTKNIYLHGPKIIKGILKNETDEIKKAKKVEELISIYDQRNRFYPGKEAYVNGMKGADMYRYMKGTTEGLKSAHEILSLAFAEAGNESTSSVLNYYFMTTTKLVQAKNLEVQDLIDLFSDLSSVISYKEAKLSQDIYNLEQQEEKTAKQIKKLKKDKKEIKTLGDVKTNLEKTLAPHATCEKLQELYEKNFETNKEEVSWLKRAAKLLSKKECTDTDIFFSISEALYIIDPSPASAANMGLRALKRKNHEKAVEFYLYAFDGEEDELNKAQYAYRLAQTHAAMSKNKTAKSYALKALSLRSGWGDPYILIGDLYAKTSRKCGELKTEFLKRVGYWAAIDKYEKAKSIDRSILEKANKRIEKYTEQMPSKTDVFTEGLIDEPTYDIDCWYKETVTIRIN